MKKIIIAIDGPAASGKSTTAKLVAAKLGYLHIDTGAMYRAMALKVLRADILPTDTHAISELAKSTTVRLVKNGTSGTGINVELDGVEVSDDIRLPEVTGIVSAVSIVPEVRALMVKEQRAMGNGGGIVLEGRDIGTVVFPDAELKIFLKADTRERARRRQLELQEKSISISLDELEKEIVERDTIDSRRALSPLRKAADAIELDTTKLTIDEQVDFIVKRASERGE